MAKKTATTALPSDAWPALADLPRDEFQKMKWLLLHAAENGIVADGVAVKFGRERRINTAKLPEFLRKETLRTLGSHAA
jgi:hypothetical protein